MKTTLVAAIALLSSSLLACGGAQSVADFEADNDLQECARLGANINCVKKDAMCSDPHATRYFLTVDSDGNVSDYSVSK